MRANRPRAVIAPILETVAAGPLRARCLIGLAVAVGQDIAAALDLLGEVQTQPNLELDVVLEARMQPA